MGEILDLFLLFLSQFAAGPGAMENNLVRFGLPAFVWAGLLMVAWGRQREYHLPREKLLIWGFGLASASATLMTIFVALQLTGLVEREVAYAILVPLQRGLGMASIIVVAGAFLHYTLQDERLARGYILAGLLTTIASLALAFWQWPRQIDLLTEQYFRLTLPAGIFQVFSSVFIVTAIVLLRRKRGWLPNVVTLALVLFLVGELLFLLNIATGENYNRIICPIGNSFPMLAIPVLGYVYFREQNIDKRRAEAGLNAYRDHLEELVVDRTAALEAVNDQLKDEVRERKQAKEAFEKVSRQYELILESAGEGICGIDTRGRFTFVNSAAAKMLGYQVNELVHQDSLRICGSSTSIVCCHPDEICPIYNSYTNGIPARGDDQIFWRKDGTNFPVLFMSSPTYENGALTGAVVIFRNITERKQAEAEIALRNANLAAQNTIAATLSRSLDLATILDTSLDAVLTVIKAEVGMVFLWDTDQEDLTLRSARGPFLKRVGSITDEKCTCCKSIAREAVDSMHAVVRDVSDHADSDPGTLIVKEDLSMLVSVPLVSNDRSVGALMLGSQQTALFQPHELELLTSIGQQIGMAIENAHLYREAERAAEELTKLHEISTILTSTLSEEKIYTLIVEQSVNLLDCQMACIFSWNEKAQLTRLVSCYGMSETERDFLQEQADASDHIKNIIKRRELVVIGDTQTDSRIPPAGREKLNIRSVLSIPIWSMEESLGSLFLLDRRPTRQWRFNEMILIENFVNRAAVALMNANLAKQLEWAAALEERQRIAADMHDGLAQTVSLLGLQIEEATELIHAGSADKAVETLVDTRETVKQVSVEVRRSIASLHKTPQPRRSIQDLLTALPEQLPLENKLELNLILNDREPLFLPCDQVDQVIFIVQEALLNAQRHAHARQINLTLDRVEQDVRITVEDDGSGFEPGTWWESSQHHFGLGIMHSRAARIGASLLLFSSPGKGTRVTLILPLDGINENEKPRTFSTDSTLNSIRQEGD